MSKALTQEYLKEALNYDPLSGAFVWKERPQKHFPTERGWRVFQSQCANKEAGYRDPSGYLTIRIAGTRYWAHRLAVLYMTGTFPKHSTDHIDQDKGNNRWNNLREVTHATNLRNQPLRSTNSSGFAGVRWNPKLNRWCSAICVAGRNIYLGTFREKSDAVAARLAANTKYEFHPNHGRANA